MNFRTELKLSPADNAIDHASKIFLIGSCFSDHMSGKLRGSGFDILANPHGILFNPKSIEKSIDDCLTGRSYSKKELLFNGEQWVSLNHHGKFNDPDPNMALKRINDKISEARNFLMESTHLIVTLGSSWVYRHLGQDRMVANCHKLPQKEFQKELLSAEEITSSLKSLVSEIRNVNSTISIILTVSPIRHLRDGMVENTLSKARLHQAVHELVRNREAKYFPSYEIMMDDLRDYRFYESDMIHPNKAAIDYIWEKFTEVWIKPSSKGLMHRVEKIYTALEHKPLNPDSPEHKEFRHKLEKEILDLQKKHPQIRPIKKGSL